MRTGELLEELFDQNPYMVALITDNEGNLLYISKTYLKILNLSKEEALGRPIKEFTPQTRVTAVLRTGKAVVGYNWRVNGYNMIASCIPIYKDGKLNGAFAYSVFLDIWNAKNLVENLLNELNMYKDEVNELYRAKYSFDDIVGNNEKLKELKAFARQIASHGSTTVLISGESGTGKELFANAIHNSSNRSGLPFIRVNCAAIPENLLEAELFGYEEGAYTGAKKGGKPGKFELANGGTVFLDEIGEMSLTMQSKLLVVLQEQEIERVGGNRPIRTNVRVIAATNRDLEKMVEEKKFREDLYYRLNVVRLEMVPLRSRKEDIPVLVQHLICKLNKKLNVFIKDISEGALKLLSSYYWPGNVRELENVLERAMIMADMKHASILRSRYFAFLNNRCEFQAASGLKSLKTMTWEFEKEAISKVLQATRGDMSMAAKYLEIDLSTLYRKLKKYHIPAEFSPNQKKRS